MTIYNEQELAPQIDEASSEYGVPSSILGAVLQTESNFNSDAISQRGNSIGMAQIETKYIPSYESQGLLPSNFSPYSVSDNINGAAAILGSDIRQTGSLDGGIEAYNAGVSGAESNGDPDYLSAVYNNADSKGKSLIENQSSSPLSVLTSVENSAGLSKGLSALKEDTPDHLTSSYCGLKSCDSLDFGCYADNALKWIECQGIDLLMIFFGLVFIVLGMNYILKNQKIFKKSGKNSSSSSSSGKKVKVEKVAKTAASAAEAGEG